MKTDTFTDMLMRNSEEEKQEWLYTNGKRPNPVSPIFFFDEVDEEELEKYLAQDRKESTI